MADIENTKAGSAAPDAIMQGSHVPTTLEDGSVGYDIGSDEVWDTYLGDAQVWHKEKTYENYYVAHKLAYTTYEGPGSSYYHKDPVFDTKGLEDDIKGQDLIIKPTDDLTEHICKTWEETDEAGTTTKYLSGISFHVKPINQDEFWTPVKEWLSENYVPSDYLQTHGWANVDSTNYYRVGRFGNSNINGELTLCMEKTPSTAWYYPFKGCSQITKLNIKCKDTADNLGITSMNSCFYGLSGCAEITYDGQPNCPSDVSDCFSVVGFTTWPRNLLRYDTIRTSNYMIDGGGIKIVPLCSLSDDRLSDVNTIVVQPQTFNCAWTDIMPRCQCNAGGLGYLSFGYNTEGKNVRICGLNQSYSFDGKKSALGDAYSYLPSLDEDSVKYLFENLTDLSTYDEELTTNDLFHNFSSWAVWGSSSNVSHGLGYAQTTANGYIVAYESLGKAGTMKITVTGIVGGTLTVYHGDTKIIDITENGDYDIDIPSTYVGNSYVIFKLDDNTSFVNPVKITLRKPYTPTAARGSAFDLYCPSEWESHITDDMVTSANAKGWTVYVGGTERTT